MLRSPGERHRSAQGVAHPPAPSAPCSVAKKSQVSVRPDLRGPLSRPVRRSAAGPVRSGNAAHGFTSDRAYATACWRDIAAPWRHGGTEHGRSPDRLALRSGHRREPVERPPEVEVVLAGGRGVDRWRESSSARSRLPSCRSTMLRFADSLHTTNGLPSRCAVANRCPITLRAPSRSPDIWRAGPRTCTALDFPGVVVGEVLGEVEGYP